MCLTLLIEDLMSVSDSRGTFESVQTLVPEPTRLKSWTYELVLF